VYGVYEKSIDRESAYEILKKRMEEASDAHEEPAQAANGTGSGSILSGIFGGGASSSGSKRARQGPFEAMMMSIARSIGSQIGRSVSRGVFGSLTSRGRRR
jgi:hypothetical protein